MKIAVLADIHGNIHALDAALAAAERLQPDQIIINGDIVNAVPNSNAVVDRVRQSDCLVTRGNHEFYYLNYGTAHDVPDSHDHERWGQLHWLVDHLTPEHGRYLATLPDDLTLVYPGTQLLRVAHGSPGHHRWGFYENQPRSEVLQFIGTVAQSTLVSAHTHVQLDRIISSNGSGEASFFATPHANHSPAPARRWHIINSGSVGMPLNSDVRAQFVLLESTSAASVWGGWKATHQRVAYDRRPALASFHSSGMIDQGGVISTLFYWEIVTAEREITLFFQWAEQHYPHQPSLMNDAFAAYVAATGRDQYIRQRDPLYEN
ncbi:MAG: metallophosphoesterase [Chloroflexi bacterium]|nr:metallophosphoesterase [Chloroflexota bacterium]